MSARSARLATRWQACSPRERRLLVVMAVAVLAFVYAQLMLVPLARWSATAGAKHARAQADLIAIEPVVAAIAALPPAAPTNEAGALAGSARELGLPVQAATDEGGGRARLVIGPVAPDLLFAWLEQRRQAGQPAGEAKVEAVAGGVTAEMVF